MNNPMVPRWHRIRRRVRESADTFTLELDPLDEGAAPCFTPGQFNMLYLRSAGEVPISLSGDPGHPNRPVHTIRAYGTVTGSMQRLRTGEGVGVRGPFGRGWPMQQLEGRDVILCAGGIGMAPLRPVLYAVLARREAFGAVTLLYGERSPGDVIYRRELERWRGRFDLEVRVTVDRADGRWRGNVGVVTTLITRLRIRSAGTVALLCGPEIMMRYAIEALAAQGVDETRMFVSMERNMQCGNGRCGHCQAGPLFICRDGPVFPYSAVKAVFHRREC